MKQVLHENLNGGVPYFIGVLGGICLAGLLGPAEESRARYSPEIHPKIN